jgi:uncharacterized membrane protein YebE (DUF533 family)
MTLLRLSPDGERLRRVAKAHAAGELSTPDYRRIRSDVIEAFADADVDFTGDATQQRWLERALSRPLDIDPVVPPAASARPTRIRIGMFALAVVVLAIVFAALSACGA